ncbi:MAG: L-2-hydroxyglutarate oxidase [Candidatus Margulisiibacteriota bacterium]
MNILIIGAGIVGLSIAKALLDHGHKVSVIEKETKVGVHASGRNSGVLHSGIYYPKDTLKAKFCQTGRPLFQEYCKKKKIQIDNCGKVLVTKNEKEIDSLNLLYERGVENNLLINKLTVTELGRISPLAKTIDSALWVPETSVFNPTQLLQSLTDEIESHDFGSLFFQEAFVEVVSETKIKTTTMELNYDVLINCAGGYADKIAHKFNLAKELVLIPFKGIYKKLNPGLANQIHHHIYPVPDLENPFLGVHFTKSMNKDVYVGPTAIPAFGPENYGLFENIGWEGANILAKDAILFLLNKKFRRVALSEPKRYVPQFFYNEAKKLLKGLTASDLYPSQKIGIRPQLVNWKTKELEMDFKIIKHGNQIHILNAISPAFTCCFAFSKYIISEYLN